MTGKTKNWKDGEAQTTATVPVLPGGEPYLFTPGPLTTSPRTKAAMQQDWGSRDRFFIDTTRDIRRRLLALADCDDRYDCVLMQGSGTFSIEAALASFVPRDGKVLVVANGAYGRRAAKILAYLGRAHELLDFGDHRPPDLRAIENALTTDPAITDVFVVHCETTSGIWNPLSDIAELVARHDRRLMVDAMSSFGALPLSAATLPFDVLVSSANKCLEGVPGFAFTLAKVALLEEAEGRSHSLSLDLHDQWQAMNANGQWRFTPPTHAVVAFREALIQHEAEGGVAGRFARYARNRDHLVAGMRAMGFETLLPDHLMAPIIVTFLQPEDSAFVMSRFYDEIRKRGFAIYPGKLTAAPTFRIGCIGQIDVTVIDALLAAIRESLSVMGVKNCAPPAGWGAHLGDASQ